MGDMATTKTRIMTFTVSAMRERVRDFASLLEGAAGEGNLTAVLIYGGMVANEFFPATSDANVVAVLQRADIETLRRLAPVVHDARVYHRIATLVLTQEEIRTSADVFPVKFLDMRDRHQLVIGRDPFVGLEISEEYLRLRCEQELKSLLFQLRSTYLQHFGSHVDLITHMLGALSGFLVTMRALLHLKHVEVGPTRRDVIYAAGTHLGVDPTCLHGLLDLKEGRVTPDPDDVAVTYGAFLNVVSLAAAEADRLKTSGGMR